jgi:hypothetical protein
MRERRIVGRVVSMGGLREQGDGIDATLITRCAAFFHPRGPFHTLLS